MSIQYVIFPQVSRADDPITSNMANGTLVGTFNNSFGFAKLVGKYSGIPFNLFDEGGQPISARTLATVVPDFEDHL